MSCLSNRCSSVFSYHLSPVFSSKRWQVLLLIPSVYLVRVVHIILISFSKRSLRLCPQTANRQILELLRFIFNLIDFRSLSLILFHLFAFIQIHELLFMVACENQRKFITYLIILLDLLPQSLYIPDTLLEIILTGILVVLLPVNEVTHVFMQPSYILLHLKILGINFGYHFLYLLLDLVSNPLNFILNLWYGHNLKFFKFRRDIFEFDQLLNYLVLVKVLFQQKLS